MNTEALQNKRVLIIVPAYNEAPRISPVIESTFKLNPRPDILVVDDGSRDGTAEIAFQAGAHVVSHPFNLGYGAALQTGHKYALAHGYDIAVQMDADGQHIADSVYPLLLPVAKDEADIVIGSRLGEVESYPIPLTRKLGIKMFSTMATFVTGKELKDVTSGFQAMNRKVMKVYASELFPVDFPDADVLIMLHKLGLRAIEIPMPMNPSEKTTSMHAGLGPIYYIVKMVLSIFNVVITDARSMKRDLS